MNSFAALIGNLTGARTSGSAGASVAGLPGAPEEGLFAGLLEGGIAAGLSAEGGSGSDADLAAALTAGDGAALQGAIDLTMLLQASTDTPDAELLAAAAALPGETAEALAIAAMDGQAADAGTDTKAGEALLEGELPAEGEVEGQAGESEPDPGESPDTQTPPGGEQTPETPAAGLAAANGEAASGAAGRDGAPGQERAAAMRPEHAQARANAAPGLAPKPAPGQQTQQAPGGAQPPAPEPDPAAAQAMKSAREMAARTETGEARDRPTALPGETPEVDAKAGGRAELARQAELLRTVLHAAPGQAHTQIVKTGKAETNPAGGIDQSGGGVQLRAAAGPAQPAAQPPQIPVNALAVHIAQQAGNGARRFDIRLDPPELGRVEVRLDVTRDGKVTTHLVVERTETLDLLQRDARALDRALQNAGLDTSEGGMKFSLKDHGGQKAQSDESRGDDVPAQSETGDAPADEQEHAGNAASAARRYLATGGLDIRI